jgi:hypothetical protein
MDDGPSADRILPGIHPPYTGAGPYVAVLSDWSHDVPVLADRVKSLVRTADALRLVVVVDDTGNHDVEHQANLATLTRAGAFVLEPDDDDQLIAVRTDPLVFAQTQIARAAQAGAPPAPPLSPIRPDGYVAFGTAVTRLPGPALNEIIAGTRTDDEWKYDS